MKSFEVNGEEIREGIPVSSEPYPHIVLGDGGNKRATRVPLLKSDSEKIIRNYLINNVSILKLKDAGGYLIIAPRDGSDNRILVLWRVASGFRGSASITHGEGVTIIAKDSAWHSGRGNLGETAEILAVLSPGQELRASRSGRRVENTRAKLVWDGKNINVAFGDKNMDAALADEVAGELL